MEDVRERIAEMARRRRMAIGSLLVATSFVLMEVAVLILLGVIDVSVIVAVALILISPIAMAIGLYMLLAGPPVLVETS